MKFRDLLKEKFYDGFNILTGWGQESMYVEVFEDPTLSEIKQIMRADKRAGVRFGVTDEKNPKIYAWVGEVMHFSMIRKIKFDLGFALDMTNPHIKLTGDYPENNWKSWDQIKNKREILNKIQKILPQFKNINFKGVGVYNIKTGKQNKKIRIPS